MKPILFVDFDGTLCYDRFWRTLPPEQNAQVHELLFGGNRTWTNEWMRGMHTSEEVTAYVAEQTGIPYEELWETFVRDASTMAVEPRLLELISKLRTKYTTVLITVNMDSFDRFTAPALKLNQYFDEMVNSYNEKRFKTDDDGAMFTDIAKKFGADIATSILVDDSEKACAVFSQLGGTALRVTKEKPTLQHLEHLVG